MAAVAAAKETMTVDMDEEKGEKDKVKEFPFSTQVRFVLERENKFFLGMT